MKKLWEEARGNLIGGLLATAALAVASWLGTQYAGIGPRPFVFSILSILGILWVIWLTFAFHWLFKKYKQANKTIILIATFHHTLTEFNPEHQKKSNER